MASRRAAPWAVAIVGALAILLLRRLSATAEAFELDLAEPGCPCRRGEDCRTFNCRAGRCANALGLVPSEQPTNCSNQRRDLVVGKRLYDPVVPPNMLAKDAARGIRYLAAANCPCTDSATCESGSCLGGRCQPSYFDTLKQAFLGIKIPVEPACPPPQQ